MRSKLLNDKLLSSVMSKIYSVGDPFIDVLTTCQAISYSLVLLNLKASAEFFTGGLLSPFIAVSDGADSLAIKTRLFTSFFGLTLSCAILCCNLAIISAFLDGFVAGFTLAGFGSDSLTNGTLGFLNSPFSFAAAEFLADSVGGLYLFPFNFIFKNTKLQNFSALRVGKVVKDKGHSPQKEYKLTMFKKLNLSETCL
uniref:Uncharacterized protein n=1 Tax=Romanomermis culicivorax TaxID=13658 RepID=A0A915KM93_ROMCU